MPTLPSIPFPLDPFTRIYHSQNGEAGIIDAIVGELQKDDQFCKFFVEIGVHQNQGNCLDLREAGWSGLFMDLGAPVTWIKRERVTHKNINELLAKYEVPQNFGVLSIDIDGQDIWVWDAVKVSPALVVIEYNAFLSGGQAIPRDADYNWDGTIWHGASLGAMDRVGKRKGYVLVHANGVNAFFVRRDRISNADQFGYDKITMRLPASRHQADRRGRKFVEIAASQDQSSQ